MEAIKKIHHISAIVGDPRENISFYEGVLKLRLVKQTVNFDDPETYHFYFGNDLAEPGTLITFFPWTTASRGRVGSGQVGRIAFRVPKERLARGRFGVGTVHHIAWSVPDDTSHRQWQDYLYEEKYNVTEIKDRQYFNAIYFIEKGNIVFEMATDGPGFTINESLEHLGETLMLPPQFESLRPQLESHLPSLSERGKTNGID